LLAGGLSAQAPARCSYDECAIRVRSTFWSTQLVRGREAVPVARIGFFAPRLPLFGERSDSAGFYYDAFRSRRNTQSILGLTGLGIAVGVVIAAASGADPPAELVLVSIPLTALAGMVTTGASDRLARAIWWYNRGLAP
jgi:hypothetical protein